MKLQDKRPSLANELRIGLTRRMTIAALAIAVLASSLHLGWTFFGRKAREINLRDALAQALQEPLRAHDLPAAYAILRAFSEASRGAQVCVRLPSGDSLGEVQCAQSKFESYPMTLSKDRFSVSFILPATDGMVFAGIPFGLAILATILLASFSLRSTTRRVLKDLMSLAVDSKGNVLWYEELAQAGERIKEGFRLREENLKLAAEARMGTIARLAGHDIRAPLEVLQVLSADLSKELPMQKREMFDRVVRRIDEVAEDLLEIGRHVDLTADGFGGTNTSLRRPEVLAPILRTLVAEKQTQYLARAGLLIELHLADGTESTASEIVARELERVLSNLVTNSVEAIEVQGNVQVSLSSDEHGSRISVRDTGKGIPQDQLNQLMEKGRSFGKEGGNGLGLFHAKEVLQSWGGTIQIESELGVGTVVHLFLPKTSLAEVPTKPDLVLIDDDHTIREMWSLEAGAAGLKLASFECRESFDLKSGTFDPETPIFIDKNGVEEGLAVAASLRGQGFRNLNLTTGERFSSIPPGLRSVVGKRFPREIKKQA